MGFPFLSREQQKIDYALDREAAAFLDQNPLSVNIHCHAYIGKNEIEGTSYKLLTWKHNQFPDKTVLGEVQSPNCFTQVAFGTYLVQELLQGTVKVVNVSPMKVGRNYHVNFYFRSRKEKEDEAKTEKRKADYYAAVDRAKGVD